MKRQIEEGRKGRHAISHHTDGNTHVKKAKAKDNVKQERAQ